MATTTTVKLQLVITDTHLTLSRVEPDAVLASMHLDVMRSDPAAPGAWKQLCGAAIAAVALDVASNPSATATAPKPTDAHPDVRVARVAGAS